MIKLLIVEDNQIVRTVLADLLHNSDDFEVIGTAENGAVALELIESGLRPDIILADLNMPIMDGIELTKQVILLNYKSKVIILTMHSNAAFLNQSLDAGAKGYLLKNGDIDGLFDAINQVYNGEVVVGSDVKT